jgi:hypothetical protein
MRKATLVALIASVLQMLIQAVFLGIYVLHLELDDAHFIRGLTIVSRCFSSLFAASLALFFWLYYRKRTPRQQVKPNSDG